MGYAHIDNLYKNQQILMFRECYALEKIHGTSAHVSYKADRPNQLAFFSGGEAHDKFVALFDAEELLARFAAFGSENATVYGEAYGGKQQGMRSTYGDNLCFTAFDLHVSDKWLSVPHAESIAQSLGFEFTHYVKVPTELEALNAQRDADSTIAIRRGMGPGKIREGVVLRPPVELTMNNGGRIVSKHKRDEFREHKSPRRVISVEKQTILTAADAIADEWVTDMRITHVLDKMFPGGAEIPEMKHTKALIAAITEDILREADGEIVSSKDALHAIATRTAQMFKARIMASLRKL